MCEVLRHGHANVESHYGAQPHLVDCKIQDGARHGVLMRANCIMERCDVSGHGLAGVEVVGGNPLCVDCHFRGSRGHGMRLLSSGHGSIHRCTFSDNGGDGVHVDDRADPELAHCVVQGNRGRGLFVSLDARAYLTSTRFAKNRGGAQEWEGGCQPGRGTGCVLQ